MYSINSLSTVTLLEYASTKKLYIIDSWKSFTSYQDGLIVWFEYKIVARQGLATGQFDN